MGDTPLFQKPIEEHVHYLDYDENNPLPIWFFEEETKARLTCMNFYFQEKLENIGASREKDSSWEDVELREYLDALTEQRRKMCFKSAKTRFRHLYPEIENPEEYIGEEKRFIQLYSWDEGDSEESDEEFDIPPAPQTPQEEQSKWRQYGHILSHIFIKIKINTRYTYKMAEHEDHEELGVLDYLKGAASSVGCWLVYQKELKWSNLAEAETVHHERFLDEESDEKYAQCKIDAWKKEGDDEYFHNDNDYDDRYWVMICDYLVWIYVYPTRLILSFLVGDRVMNIDSYERFVVLICQDSYKLCLH